VRDADSAGKPFMSIERAVQTFLSDDCIYLDVPPGPGGRRPRSR
jgi:hypothetical protein